MPASLFPNPLLPKLANAFSTTPGAAAIVVTPERRKLFRFGPGFYQVSPKLVYRNGRNKPASLAEVNGNLMVAAGSSGEDLLKAISKQHLSLEQALDLPEELLGEIQDAFLDGEGELPPVSEIAPLFAGQVDEAAQEAQAAVASAQA